MSDNPEWTVDAQKRLGKISPAGLSSPDSKASGPDTLSELRTQIEDLSCINNLDTEQFTYVKLHQVLKLIDAAQTARKTEAEEKKKLADRKTVTEWWEIATTIRNGMLTPKGYLKKNQEHTLKALDKLCDAIDALITEIEKSEEVIAHLVEEMGDVSPRSHKEK